jgi:hypothetical protein
MLAVEPRVLYLPAPSLVSMLTELDRLPTAEYSELNYHYTISTSRALYVRTTSVFLQMFLSRSWK